MIDLRGSAKASESISINIDSASRESLHLAALTRLYCEGTGPWVTDEIDTIGQSVVIGKIICDCHDRRRRGEQVDFDTLAREFPDHVDEIRLEWSLLERVCSTDVGKDVENLQVYAAFAQLMPGSRFGDYDLDEMLGSGGSSVVFKARDPKLNRPIALKVLRPELATDQIGAKRFEREAMSIGGLRHPNIVGVHSVGSNAGLRYIVMEYIEGPSLAAVLRERAPLRTDEVRLIHDGIISGLSAAHDARVIHRDIKPANILIDAAAGGRPRIVDFGLARTSQATTQLTLPESVIGTIEYMSPEQARGDTDIDFRTDLYSAGVVLYEMLTGVRPFKSETLSGTLHRVLNETPIDPATLRPGVDPELTRLAIGLMSKDRELRSVDGNARALKRTYLSIGSMRKSIIAAVTLMATVLIVMFIWPRSPEPGEGFHQSSTTSAPQIAEGAVFPQIRDARIRRGFGSQIEVWRGDSTASRAIPITDPSSNMNFVAVTACQTANGTFIVAANDTEIHGKSLFVYNDKGSLETSVSLANDYVWPDCSTVWQMQVRPGRHAYREAGGPTNDFLVNANVLFSVDIDGDLEEEVVIVARENSNYPTRISILEPGTWALNRTFWHMGQIDVVRMLENYFAPGHHALLAFGCNNKLDGFGEPPPFDYKPLPGESMPVTRYNYVPVAMILDPMSAEFDGLGPPHTNRVADLRPVSPVAYAYLDMPSSLDNYTDDPRRDEIRIKPENAASIAYEVIRTEDAASGGAGTILLAINDHSTFEIPWGNQFGKIIVDMRLRAVLDDDGRPKANSETEFELASKWHVYPSAGNTKRRSPFE